MLFTPGEVPVAQEFANAGRPGELGSEFSPVSAECPIAMIPMVSSVDVFATEVDAAVDGDVDVVVAPVVAGSGALDGVVVAPVLEVVLASVGAPLRVTDEPHAVSAAIVVTTPSRR